MVERGAFVLYLSPACSPMVRLDGRLQPISDHVLKPEELEAFAKPLMSENQMAEFKEKKTINLVASLPGVCRFRIHCFLQRGSVGIVVQRVKTEIPSLDQLSLPAVLKDLSLSDEGLILIVGISGSGKSTTLAAMVDHRNQNGSSHIVSIEDPMEFTHRHKKCIVSQRELGCDTYTFAQALKDSLQQAPDVVAISAIRDGETMDSAISIAEAGRLCIATLKAANPTQALERILTLFPTARRAEILLRLALNSKAIVAQRLFQTSDGRRLPAVEILVICGPIKTLIEKGEIGALQDATEKSGQQGCQTFDQSLFSLYQHGKISRDDALAHAESATKLRQKMSSVEPTKSPDAAKSGDQLNQDKQAKLRIRGLELAQGQDKYVDE